MVQHATWCSHQEHFAVCQFQIHPGLRAIEQMHCQAPAMSYKDKQNPLNGGTMLAK